MPRCITDPRDPGTRRGTARALRRAIRSSICGVCRLWDRWTARCRAGALAGRALTRRPLLRILCHGQRLSRAGRRRAGHVLSHRFLVRHFDRLVIEDLKLNTHPTLRDTLFAHYTRVVYLAQTEDTALVAGAQRAADQLALPWRSFRPAWEICSRQWPVRYCVGRTLKRVERHRSGPCSALIFCGATSPRRC